MRSCKGMAGRVQGLPFAGPPRPADRRNVDGWRGLMILFQVLPVIIIQLWMDALILPLELSGVIQCAPDVTSCQPEELSESLVDAEGQPLNKYDESLIEAPFYCTPRTRRSLTSGSRRQTSWPTQRQHRAGRLKRRG
jgi:hypothetical protein